MTRYLAFAARRPRLLLAGFAICAAVALACASRLELHSDMAELLPANHPAVAALTQLADHQRLGQSLVVLVESPDRDADLRFLAALRARLVGSQTFAEIDWGPNRELAGWKHRWRWLYADLPTLQRAEELLDRAYLAHNPLFMSLDDDDPKAELEKLELSHPEPPTADYYETTIGHTHRVAIMLWRPPHGLGSTSDHRALGDVKAAIAAVEPARFHPAMTVQLGGHLAQTIEDQDSIRDDLTVATALCSGLIFAAIWLYFRRVALVLIVFAPAVLGLFVALAIASFTLHALNLNTAFLISIILGNGINSPIVLLARYGEERGRGASVDRALDIAVRATLRGTLAAMGAASIAYGSLAITDFRGFSQFGLLGGAGMLLVWIATFFVVPPLVHVVDASPRAMGWRRAFGALGRAVTRRPAAVLVASIALAIAAIGPIRQLARDPIEWNLRALRTPDTTSRSIWDKVEALGMTNPDTGYVGSHGALLVDTPDQADAVADALRAQDRALGDPVFEQVRTYRSLLPPDEDAKLALLARVRAKIDRRAGALSDAERDELAKYRPPDDLRAMTTDDLPPIARRAFSERDGTVGRLVLMTVDPTAYSDWNGHDLIRLGRHLQVDALGTHWVAASPSTVFAGMLETLVRDGPKIAAVALIGVVLLAFAVLGPRAGWRALATQLVALAWFGGAVGALAMKINFFNFVALPITLGVGADYAANLVSRLAGEGAVEAMAGTGAAVALCSITTIIGYSSLLSSTNPALRSFGVLADIGEISCLAAALVVLPALATLTNPSRRRSNA
ncbi:MAG TPA: MMPL family transporter [Kofleriaceae bacterium]|nr:MMPL family transporter [Kofleriaceae bacterium]